MTCCHPMDMALLPRHRVHHENLVLLLLISLTYTMIFHLL
nr:unnamed protein product [Callosobruchus chinensis]